MLSKLGALAGISLTALQFAAALPQGLESQCCKPIKNLGFDMSKTSLDPNMSPAQILRAGYPALQKRQDVASVDARRPVNYGQLRYYPNDPHGDNGNNYLQPSEDFIWNTLVDVYNRCIPFECTCAVSEYGDVICLPKRPENPRPMPDFPRQSGLPPAQISVDQALPFRGIMDLNFDLYVANPNLFVNDLKKELMVLGERIGRNAEREANSAVNTLRDLYGWSQDPETGNWSIPAAVIPTAAYFSRINSALLDFTGWVIGDLKAMRAPLNNPAATTVVEEDVVPVTATAPATVVTQVFEADVTVVVTTAPATVTQVEVDVITPTTVTAATTTTAAELDVIATALAKRQLNAEKADESFLWDRPATSSKVGELLGSFLRDVTVDFPGAHYDEDGHLIYRDLYGRLYVDGIAKFEVPPAPEHYWTKQAPVQFKHNYDPEQLARAEASTDGTGTILEPVQAPATEFTDDEYVIVPEINEWRADWKKHNKQYIYPSRIGPGKELRWENENLHNLQQGLAPIPEMVLAKNMEEINSVLRAIMEEHIRLEATTTPPYLYTEAIRNVGNAWFNFKGALEFVRMNKFSNIGHRKLMETEAHEDVPIRSIKYKTRLGYNLAKRLNEVARNVYGVEVKDAVPRQKKYDNWIGSINAVTTALDKLGRGIKLSQLNDFPSGSQTYAADRQTNVGIHYPYNAYEIAPGIDLAAINREEAKYFRGPKSELFGFTPGRGAQRANLAEKHENSGPYPGYLGVGNPEEDLYYAAEFEIRDPVEAFGIAGAYRVPANPAVASSTETELEEARQNLTPSEQYPEPEDFIPGEMDPEEFKKWTDKDRSTVTLEKAYVLGKNLRKFTPFDNKPEQPVENGPIAIAEVAPVQAA